MGPLSPYGVTTNFPLMLGTAADGRLPEENCFEISVVSAFFELVPIASHQVSRKSPDITVSRQLTGAWCRYTSVPDILSQTVRDSPSLEDIGVEERKRIVMIWANTPNLLIRRPIPRSNCERVFRTSRDPLTLPIARAFRTAFTLKRWCQAIIKVTVSVAVAEVRVPGPLRRDYGNMIGDSYWLQYPSRPQPHICATAVLALHGSFGA
jgi:hypothetical protein